MKRSCEFDGRGPRMAGVTGPVGDDLLRAAIDTGRVNALAARAHRRLDRDLARIAPGLGGVPLDAAQVGMVAQIGVHCTGWLAPDPLHAVNLAGVWTFVADWLIDHRAASIAEVDDLVARCVAVGQHAPLAPDDGVGARLVAAIRDGLRLRGPADAWGPAWVAEIRRYLTAMRLELQWRSGAKPSIDEYLSNHDSVGLRFAFATLLVVDEAGPEDWRPGPGTLSEAADATALVIRLANDLAGAARERAYGDVNVLTLGMASEQVGDRIRRETERCRELYAAVPPVHQRRVSYLERVLGFNLGVYGAGDYWAPDAGA